mgnify:CR=1 FL=1
MILNTLRRLFGNNLSNPDKGPQTGGRNPPVTESGVSVSDEKALKMSGVWSCVQLISNSVVGLPILVFDDTSDGRVMIEGRHYLKEILHRRPNQWMTPRDFRSAMTVQMALWGNAYAEILRSGDRIVGLVPLRPGRMTPFIDDTGALVYHYQIDSGVKVYAKRSIFHIKGITTDGVVGAERIEFAKESVGLAAAAQSFASAQFRNGGRPGGVLEFDKFLNDAQRQQARKLYEGVSEGVINKNKLWLLEGGVKYTALDFTADKMQMIATRNLQLSEIARYFGVPGIMIGAGENTSTAWPASFEQQMLMFLTFTVQPYLDEWESAIKNALIMDAQGATDELSVDHDIEPLVQMDSQARAKYWSTLVQNGLASRNEGRIKNKLPKSEDPGADRLTVQVNMTNLGDLQGLHDAGTDSK